MKKLASALALVVLACSGGPRLSSAPPRGEALVEVKGAVKGGPFRLGREELAALPQGKVEGTDPVTGRAATWEGTDLAQIARRLELKKGADTLVVRTADQRAVPIPLTVIRQLKPVLASRADGAPLPELVLAWPTGAQPGLRTDPRARLWWAARVRGIEVVNGYTTYGVALAVPEGSPDGARPGADIFAARCIACHRVRQTGGEAAPELSKVADRIRPDAFFQLLARHPGWADPGDEVQTAHSASQVWSFLRAVAASEDAAGEGGPGGTGPGTAGTGSGGASRGTATDRPGGAGGGGSDGRGTFGPIAPAGPLGPGSPLGP